ncbi:MAG: hypothetical protein HYV04_00070 [Deltaproteobacteria bacterium]|nr:hypothetical protein [Deltaproteobacteria bacterium]
MKNRQFHTRDPDLNCLSQSFLLPPLVRPQDVYVYATELTGEPQPQKQGDWIIGVANAPLGFTAAFFQKHRHPPPNVHIPYGTRSAVGQQVYIFSGPYDTPC